MILINPHSLEDTSSHKLFKHFRAQRGSCSHLNSATILAYLADIHARITAQRLRRHESVWANHSGEQTSLINLLNGGAIHKVDNTSLIHCNTWAREKEREGEGEWAFGNDGIENEWRSRKKEKGKKKHMRNEEDRVRKRSKEGREEDLDESFDSVRDSAQQATVLSKALHHRNVIIFPFRSPLKGLEQCNWRKKLFVTLDVSRLPQWTFDIWRLCKCAFKWESTLQIGTRTCAYVYPLLAQSVWTQA